jgi:uncharacterized HAD superfamily protein
MAKPKPLLGVDLDGCLYDFDSAARAVLRLHGCKVDAHVSTYWDSLKDEVGPVAWRWMWENEHARRDIFRSGPPYQDGIKGVRQLEQIVDIAIITHRPLDVADITLSWLGERKLHPRAVHHAAGMDKSTVAECIAYVEDRGDNAVEIAAAMGGPVFVPRRAWNEGLEEVEGLRYFERWGEVTKWVRSYLTRGSA